jgi:hypothetical protein
MSRLQLLAHKILLVTIHAFNIRRTIGKRGERTIEQSSQANPGLFEL